MIDPRELRIGNYVSILDRGKIEPYYITTKITQILHNEVKTEYHKYTDSCLCINPIPLTEDILLRCGFKPYKSPFAGHWYENFYFELANLRPDDDLWVVRIFKHDMPNCYKYLHQIQNLWSDVTGEELNVQL